jgi:hypothetical protein
MYPLSLFSTCQLDTREDDNFENRKVKTRMEINNYLITDAETKYIREITKRIDYRTILEKAVIHTGIIELVLRIPDSSPPFRIDMIKVARFQHTHLSTLEFNQSFIEINIRIQRCNVKDFDENDEYFN